MQVSENRAPKDLQVSKDVAPEIYVCVRRKCEGQRNINVREKKT